MRFYAPLRFAVCKRFDSETFKVFPINPPADRQAVVRIDFQHAAVHIDRQMQGFLLRQLEGRAFHRLADSAAPLARYASGAKVGIVALAHAAMALGEEAFRAETSNVILAALVVRDEGLQILPVGRTAFLGSGQRHISGTHVVFRLAGPGIVRAALIEAALVDPVCKVCRGV